MPHSPKNRAKRRRFSNPENQVITQTDFQIATNSANIFINSPPTPTISPNETQTATNLPTNISNQPPMNCRFSTSENQVITQTDPQTATNSTNVSHNSQPHIIPPTNEMQDATNFPTNFSQQPTMNRRFPIPEN